MPLTINGFYLGKSPRDESLFSYPIPLSIPAGTTVRRSFINEFRGPARSIVISNRDGVNAAFIRYNGITSPQIRIPPSGSFPINDQWVTDIEVAAGAADSCDVIAEIVPQEQVLT